MKLESQVVNLELSKQLKEAGYPQEGLWWWHLSNVVESGFELGLQNYSPETHEVKPYFVAPTVAELGERLPKVIRDCFIQFGYASLPKNTKKELYI